MTIPEGIEAPAMFMQPIATQQITFQPITTLAQLSGEQEGDMSNVLVTQPLNIGTQIIGSSCDKDCQALNLQPGQTLQMLQEFQGGALFFFSFIYLFHLTNINDFCF